MVSVRCFFGLSGLLVLVTIDFNLTGIKSTYGIGGTLVPGCGTKMPPARREPAGSLQNRSSRRVAG